MEFERKLATWKEILFVLNRYFEPKTMAKKLQNSCNSQQIASNFVEKCKNLCCFTLYRDKKTGVFTRCDVFIKRYRTIFGSCANCMHCLHLIF